MLKRASGYVFLHRVMAVGSGTVNMNLATQVSIHFNRVTAMRGEQILEIGLNCKMMLIVQSTILL